MLVWLALVSVGVGLSFGQDGFFLLSGPTNNVIYRLDSDKKLYTDIPIPNQMPSTIEYDSTTERIFFGTTYDIHVYSIKMDGSDIREEATTDMYAVAIAVDSVRRYLFVCSNSHPTLSITRIQLDQDATLDNGVVIATTANGVNHIAADPSTGTLFWGSYEGIYQCNYNGSEKRQVFNNTANCNGLTYDEHYIYVMKGSVIWRIDRLTLSPSQLFIHKYRQDSQGLAAAGDHLYFVLNYCEQGNTGNCNTHVSRVDKKGIQYESFGTTIRTPHFNKLQLVYVPAPTDVISPATTTAPCQEDEDGMCIHVVNDNYNADTGSSNNALVVCLVLLAGLLILASIGFVICWKKISALHRGNEDASTGQYTVLTEQHKF